MFIMYVGILLSYVCLLRKYQTGAHILLVIGIRTSVNQRINNKYNIFILHMY